MRNLAALLATGRPVRPHRGRRVLPLLLLLAGPLSAQTRTLDPDEVLGGAAYNLALRIPLHFAPKRARGVLPRLVLFTLGSLLYESFLDPYHTVTDSVGRWTSTGQMRADIKGREIGYIAMEAVVLGATWLVRRVRRSGRGSAVRVSR